MALSAAYITRQEYYDAIKKPLSTAAEDTIVDRQTISVSRFVDKISNRVTFNKDDAPTARTVRASHDGYLDLRSSGMPGLATDTGFISTVNGILLVPATDLKFLPLNALVNGDPYTEIELLSGAQIGSFYDPTGFITITGTWGYPAVPSIVKDICIELLGIWRAEGPRSTGRMSELQDVVNTSPLADQLVNRFIKSIRTAAIG